MSPRPTTRTKPANPALLGARVARRELVTPTMWRVTVAGSDLGRLEPLGYDQWFRLFLPTGGGGLDRLPDRLTTASYARYLTIPAARRPVLRNYTIRALREAGGGVELDIDFVAHGSGDDAHAGPAAHWAATCEPGDELALIDEGITVSPPAAGVRQLLVGDESALPAIAGILRSTAGAGATAIIELADAADAQPLGGDDVRFVVRAQDDRPGGAALRELDALELDGSRVEAFAAGEQALATGARRRLVARGVDKRDIRFVGYWRRGAS